MGALDGLKVIELAHIMSGPTAGMLLADMGADVIRIDRIGGNFDSVRMRHFGIDFSDRGKGRDQCPADVEGDGFQRVQSSRFKVQSWQANNNFER